MAVRFTSTELRAKLVEVGIQFAYNWQLPDTTYETVDDRYPQDVFDAIVEEFRLNAPELLTVLQLGGGKTRLVPKWIEEAGDCDDGAFVMMSKALIGNWRNAIAGGPRVARCMGVFFYTATPRAENRFRAGGHAKIWYINHNQQFRVYEDFDGEAGLLTGPELMSAGWGIAA